MKILIAMIDFKSKQVLERRQAICHILSEVESIADTIGIINHGNMIKEISMKEISEMNTAYIEVTTPDAKKAAYVLSDKLKLNNFKIMDEHNIRIYESHTSTNDISKTLALNEVEISAIFLIAGELETDETKLSYSGSMLKTGVELFTNMSYMVFTSVMLASFIVSAYKNKTMNLMFSYPISRKKIILSQMLSVWIFNFIALVLSKILIYCALTAVKKYTYITAEDIALGNGMFYAGEYRRIYFDGQHPFLYHPVANIYRIRLSYVV